MRIPQRNITSIISVLLDQAEADLPQSAFMLGTPPLIIMVHRNLI